jgi:hypothetical protein
MDNDRRLTQLEAKLTGKQRGLAWLKRLQQQGGYVELCRRGLESGAVDRFVIDDEDSAFVFHCIGRCNNQALKLAFYGDEASIRALYLRRLLHGIDLPDWSDLQRFRSILKDFVVEGLALASAIQGLSEHHLGGHTILFRDAEQGLAERNAVGRKLCHLFNRIVPAYGEEPIAAAELDEAVGIETGKENKSMAASELSSRTPPLSGQTRAKSRPHIAQRGPASLREIRSPQSLAVTEWPAHVDEERYALGACFCGQAVDATRLLEEDDFSLGAHREIFAAISALIEEGETAIEFPLVAGELARRGQLDAIGGTPYLCDLADGVVLARPMASRAKRLREFAERRRLLTASAELERRARDLATPVCQTQAWLREVAE